MHMTATGEKLPPLWKTWLPLFLGWCAILLAIRWTRIVDYQMEDPDDFMRMLQVRDWIGGQSWFDVSQYRLNVPEGASMHWSRYVDVPLRAVIELFTPLIGQNAAEITAMTVVPLAILGLILYAVYRAICALTGDWRTALIGAALVPTNLLIFIQTLPMRVDHHSWQIAMAAVAFWAMVDSKLRRGPEIAGLALAFWMHVSIEGLPYAVVVGLIYGWFYLTERDRCLLRYLPTLTAASLFFLATTRSANDLIIAYCDAVSWPLIVSLGAVSAILWLGDRLNSSATPFGRIAIMAAAGVAGTALFLGSGQSCAIDPFANLEPLVRKFWYEDITEGLDIRWQHGLVIVVILMISIIGFAGTLLGWKQQNEPEQKKRWLIQLMLVGITFLIALKVMRGAAVAELTAVTGTAVLIRAAFAKIMLWRLMLARVSASVLVAFALSPVSALFAGNILSPLKIEDSRKAKDTSCELKQLGALPKMKLFTNMGIGPSILLRTHHSSYSSGYHRSHVYMNNVIKAFTGTEAEAKEIILGSSTDHVLFCANQLDFKNYIDAAPNGLAARLGRGDAPDWLEAAPGMQRNQLWIIKRPEGTLSGQGQ
jgi:hypothetical protein